MQPQFRGMRWPPQRNRFPARRRSNRARARRPRPGLSGNSATYKLRAHGYRCQIVTLSANASADARDASLRAGANHYLTKPLELERFTAVMRRAIEQGAKEPT